MSNVVNLAARRAERQWAVDLINEILAELRDAGTPVTAEVKQDIVDFVAQKFIEKFGENCAA